MEELELLEQEYKRERADFIKLHGEKKWSIFFDKLDYDKLSEDAHERGIQILELMQTESNRLQ